MMAQPPRRHSLAPYAAGGAGVRPASAPRRAPAERPSSAASSRAPPLPPASASARVRAAAAARAGAHAARLTSAVVLSQTAHAQLRASRSVGKGAHARIKAEEAIAARIRTHAVDVAREARALGSARALLVGARDEMRARQALAYACVSTRGALPPEPAEDDADGAAEPPPPPPQPASARASALSAGGGGGAERLSPAHAAAALGRALRAELELLADFERTLRRHVAHADAVLDALADLGRGLAAALRESGAHAERERALAATHGAGRAAAAGGGGGGADGLGGGSELELGLRAGALPERAGGLIDARTAALLDDAFLACGRAREARALCADLGASTVAEARAAASAVLRGCRAVGEALGAALGEARSGLLLATAERRRVEHVAGRLRAAHDEQRRALDGVARSLRHRAASGLRPRGGGFCEDSDALAAARAAGSDAGLAAAGAGGSSGVDGGGPGSAASALYRSELELSAAVDRLRTQLASANAEAAAVAHTEASLRAEVARLSKARAIEEECLLLRQSKQASRPPPSRGGGGGARRASAPHVAAAAGGGSGGSTPRPRTAVPPPPAPPAEAERPARGSAASDEALRRIYGHG